MKRDDDMTTWVEVICYAVTFLLTAGLLFLLVDGALEAEGAKERAAYITAIICLFAPWPNREGGEA